MFACFASRSAGLALVPLLLSGCAGYSPLYAPLPGEAALPTLTVGVVDMTLVEIEPGERRVAQEVRQRLKQAYPDLPTSDAVVHVAITEETTALALQRTATVQRAQLTLTGALRVVGAEGADLLETELTATTAYNVQNTPFASASGETYARQVAARNLAEAAVRRLALWQKLQAQQRDAAAE